jgi:hypothetical protein
MSTAAVTIVVSEVITPEGEVYFSAFNVATGEKVAPWADADTPEGVMEALLQGQK